MIKILLLFIAVLLFTTANAQSIEVTTADGYGADTYLTNDAQKATTHADSCHGDEESMYWRTFVGTRMKIAYFRFDVSSVKDIDTQVESVKLGLWPTLYKGTADGYPELSIYAMTNEDLDFWEEATTSYNLAPGFEPYMDVGSYGITEDLTLVEIAVMDDQAVAPGVAGEWRDGIAFFYSEGSDELDDFVNNDSNGLLTFAVLGPAEEDQYAEGEFATKEDSVSRAPKLLFNIVTAIDDENVPILSEYELNQNYPNPFNPATNIEFTLIKSGHTTLEIFNTLGQPVATLVDGQMSSGHHQITFTADGYTSGIYFYKLTSGNFTEVKKMMLLK